jgi:[ribosomal protein S5]-alanine N-acetyltransferase
MLVATTNRLLIRYALPDDATFILELLNTPGWLRFIGNRNIATLDDAMGYLTERVMASYTQYGHGLNTITLPDGTPVGLCGILKRDNLPLPDIGFAFLPQHSGKGYAYEAAMAILEDAHTRLGYHQIAAITDQDNIISINLLKKLGFVLKGLVELDGEAMELNYFVRELAAEGNLLK